MFQEKPPETFSDKVTLDSCPPELGDMEQPVTDRGNPSHTSSGAPLQASALSVELNSCTESGIIQFLINSTILNTICQVQFLVFFLSDHC